MEAFDHIYQPHLLGNLESGLDEYLWFALDAVKQLVDARREHYES
jgi:hypothetical protein